MDWINVNDKLPEKDQVILAYSPIDGLGLAVIDSHISRTWYWLYKKTNGSRRIQLVTYWTEVKPPTE